ncbi:MAG: hypothetical protein ABS62_07020 [Microbacterium sp. SCN 70-200]|uniref:hypothetical protein n=1 Tax=unclassified Microbacterium TaxID=2609290 RepID=UPI00086FA256|nr:MULTISPECIES: hypothetical protein [unclassified Microbacterium]MBN9215420.1 hypothetical protein [Microbacterium sp.]ODT41140.1 MAG: hypothetical protein ABS62_07020 [Microbacterium sp. SCN 70-200]OJV79465.1 MAG: hypothetical protein BGO46_03880 [Microbacterium sp. 70-16]
MARSFLPRTSTRLPGRGKALVKVTLVDENGFTYEYADLEVPMGVARDAVAQLHLQSDAVASAAAAPAEKAPADSRRSRRRTA